MNAKGVSVSAPESKHHDEPDEQRSGLNSTESGARRYTESIGDAERRSVHSLASHELEEATPGVGEPGIPTGDDSESPAKAADRVAKAEGETAVKSNNPESTVPKPDLADTTGKQSQRPTMRFLPKGRPNRPTSGSKKRGGGGGCIIF